MLEKGIEHDVGKFRKHSRTRNCFSFSREDIIKYKRISTVLDISGSDHDRAQHYVSLDEGFD